MTRAKHKHSKRYDLHGTGVGVFCDTNGVMANNNNQSNFAGNCSKCGVYVITAGHSPDTDRVWESP